MATKRIRQPTGIVGKDEKFDNSKFYLEHGVDLEKRTVSILSDIDNDSAAYVIRGLKKMLEVNSDPDDETSAIDVEIGSYGGDVYYGFAIYNAIRQCPVTVRTHGQGPVMSAGLLIYLAGDERYADQDVSFMAHGCSSDFRGKELDQTVDLNELKRLNQRKFQRFGEHTEKTATWWVRKTRNNDFYFDYEQAVDLGVITHEYQEQGDE